MKEETKLKYQTFGIKGLNKQFRMACKSGHLEIIQYLLTSSELKENVNIHMENDYAFRTSCRLGHLNIVKYLLASAELTEHINIHSNNELGLRRACENGHLEIVQYLLTSPELKEHADIYVDDNIIFKYDKMKFYPDLEHFLMYYKLDSVLKNKSESNIKKIKL